MTLRILFCNYEYPPIGGGGGVINALLAEELARRHEVTILTSQGLGLPAESIENGVKILRVPVYFRRQKAAANLLSLFAYMPSGIRAGKRWLREFPCDVINTHFVLPSGPVGDRLAKFAGIPNVLSVHGGDLYDPSKLTSPHRHAALRAWVRRLLRRADRVVGQSRNTLENVSRFYAPEIKGVRIPLGIKRPVYEACRRADFGYTPDDVLFATVGRLVARKAVEQLLRVMETMAPHRPRLLVLGDGPQESALRSQANALGIADRVNFLGHVSEDRKFGILKMSDVFVSTSQHEGFGLVFLEAMACGLPVICYNHGGQTDFLGDGQTGYLVNLNDIAMFQERSRELARDRDKSRRMGQENLRRVEELFIDRCAQRYEDIFDEVIADQRRKIAIGYASRP
jgi:glycosyltransferase involved in cell wall biosynthesis